MVGMGRTGGAYWFEASVEVVVESYRVGDREVDSVGRVMVVVL